MAEVGTIATGGRRGQTFERIGDPHGAVCHTVHLQKGAHEDRRTTAPSAGLDKVTGNIVPEDILDAHLDILKASVAYHRITEAWPIPPLFASRRVKRLLMDQQE